MSSISPTKCRTQTVRPVIMLAGTARGPRPAPGGNGSCGKQDAECRLTASALAGTLKPPMAATSAKRAARADDVQHVLLAAGPVLNTRTMPLPTTNTPGQGSSSRKMTCPLSNWQAGR